MYISFRTVITKYLTLSPFLKPWCHIWTTPKQENCVMEKYRNSISNNLSKIIFQSKTVEQKSSKSLPRGFQWQQLCASPLGMCRLSFEICWHDHWDELEENMYMVLKNSLFVTFCLVNINKGILIYNIKPGVCEPRVPPKISMALLAMTSLVFMLLWVPDPVCQMTVKYKISNMNWANLN